MTDTMKAVVLHEPGRLIMESCPIPQPKANELLLKTRAVGICGSDIHAYHGQQPSMNFPGIMGHEIVAEVVHPVIREQGAPVLNPGDRVVVDPSIVCGQCYTCSIGRWNVCEELQVLGVHKDGGFAEFLVARDTQVHKVPDHVTDMEAVLAEPFSIAAQTIERSRIGREDHVAVFGAGPIGLAIMVMAKSLQCTVTVIDLLASRLTIAQQLGADRVIDASNGEEFVRDGLAQAYPSGVPVVVDAVGVRQTAALSMDCVSRAGRVVVVGLAKPDVTVDFLRILKKEIDIIGSRMTRGHFPSVVEFLAAGHGRAMSETAVTHRFGFHAMIDGFYQVEQNPESVIKAVIVFDE